MILREYRNLIQVSGAVFSECMKYRYAHHEGETVASAVCYILGNAEGMESVSWYDLNESNRKKGDRKMSNNPERQEGMEGQSELDIHGCMEELKNESAWVVTNWDGEVLCR